VVEPRFERELRIGCAIAMWLGGAIVTGAASVLLSAGHANPAGLRGLSAWCVVMALVVGVVWPRLSDRMLSFADDAVSGIGSLSVWLACYWSGGPASGLTELMFFPVLFDAYFFRGRTMVAHLLANTALALSPLLYAHSLAGTQFAGHAVMLVAAFWGMSIVVWQRKQRLLEAEVAARRQALTDPLTGVHNRRGLAEDVATLGTAPGTAILLLDLDDFKGANSRHGHVGADRLLESVAQGLVGIARPGDCVARVGGDEFAILARDRTETELARLRRACDDTVGSARTAANLPGPDAAASIGVAICPQDGGNLSELLDAADRSMYADKATKPGRRDRSRATSSAPAEAPRSPQADRPQRPVEPPISGGAVASWWRARPAQAITVATGSVASGLLTTVAILLPGADTTHTAAVVALAGAAIAAGLVVLVVAHAAVYTAIDALAVPLIALGVYLTGGATSPLLPLIFFAVAIAAYFFTPRRALVTLATAIFVCATPLLYTAGSPGLQYVERFVALVTTALTLAALVAYNKRALAAARAEAQELAERDPLTGLANRRQFHARLDAAAAAAQHTDTVAALAIIDLDNFKRVNDCYGHSTGDRLLRAIAAALRVTVRPGDCIARIGGDEFALVLSATAPLESRRLGLRCVEAIERAAAETGCDDCEVSATVGVALLGQHAHDANDLIQVADRALMNAKDAGKRRVATPDWTLTVAS
jgi:diguanylate cyclase (GGDEF)-like protein